MADFPLWLATEDAVRHFFVLLGFTVETVSILGRQIDVLAHRIDSITGDRAVYVIEVTLEKVGVEKGSKDSQKLLLARAQHSNAHLMLISTAGFTDDQEATLKALGIVPRRFHELESTLLPLYKYALNTKSDLEHPGAPDIGYHPSFYIEPQLKIERVENDPEVVVGSDWIAAALHAPQPGICAVLGSLGSGKTSFLKRVLEYGISRFIEDPDTRPLPLYVPLGRYKQHAGDLNQMLMAELSRSGIDNYPTSYVRYLLETRRTVVLLDGLDEVHPIQNTDDVLETVTNLMEGIGKQASAVISCRRQFFESSAEEQAYFGSYTAGKLKDLNAGLQRLLRGNPSTHIIEISPFDITRIRQYLLIRCGLSAEETDKLLARYYGFLDMASTPVLLAMIATTVSEGTLKEDVLSFPLVQLYEAYTTRWIERDVGRARLSANQRTHFSEYLADRMLWEEKESASWSDISDVLRRGPDWGNTPLTNEEAELDIRNSGFLVRDLDDKWRFVHRSILEYFAARVEVTRLSSGERPRYIPTDGYRLFLIELLARQWLDEGQSPFPARAWPISRGDDVRSNQWSLLAAASKVIPIGARGELTGINALRLAGEFSWTATKFRGISLNIENGRHDFVNCEFTGCQVSVDNVAAIVDFQVCQFHETTLRFKAMPEWATSYDPAGARGAAEVPIAVWDLSAAVQAGADVYVNNAKWVMHESELLLFLECARRLRGKTFKHNFLRGSMSGELEAVLPALTQKGLVEEDASRQEHQLTWTSEGRAIATRLATDPVRAQAEVASLF